MRDTKTHKPRFAARCADEDRIMTEDKRLRTWVYGSNWGKRISLMLVTTLLLPLLMMTLPAKPARAQVARLPQVAVLDFGVLPAVKASGILGRNATDAVVIEMTRTGRYDVSPRATVNQQLADLGLATPLNNVGIQKLGQALGSDFVASGDIVDVSFQENPRRARISLSVRLTDVVTGELANGAIETGFSAPSAPGFTPDDEALLSDAIQNASFNAVRTITSYSLPSATILQIRGDTEVILNRGAQDGVSTGLDMVVFRGTDRVGKIRVTTVRATNSTAAITDIGKGIRPEDKARAIFSLAGYKVTTAGDIERSPIKDIQSYKPRKKNNSKSILTVVLGLAAAIIIATLIFDKRSRTNGSGIGALTARAFSEPSDIAGGGSSARVQIDFEAAADTPVNNIIEYQIFRDGNIIGVTTQNTTRYIDSPELANQTITYNEIVFGGSVITGPNNTTTTGTATTGTTGTLTTTGTTTTGATGTNNTGGNTQGNTQGGSQDQPTALRVVTATVSGLQPGVPHTYSVRVLFRQVTATTPSGGGAGGQGGGIGGQGGGQGGGIGGQGGGQGGGIGGQGGGVGGQGGGQTAGQFLFKLTPLIRMSGTATPLARPVISGPSGDQNIARVPVNFSTVQGGNTYIVEFSTSPSFSDKRTPNLRNGTGQPFFQSGTGLAASATEFDLSKEAMFRNLPGGARIFFRVGVRNSNDAPGPLQASTKGVPSGGEYIYSTSVTENFFTKINPPPDAPQANPTPTAAQ